MNRCPKIEWGRLSGEIGWHGVNSRIISARKPVAGVGFQRLSLASPKGEARDAGSARISLTFAGVCLYAPPVAAQTPTGQMAGEAAKHAFFPRPNRAITGRAPHLPSDVRYNEF